MLVNCAAYKDGKRISDITIDEISDYVSQPDCFVWVALKDASPAEIKTMQEEFGLHELAVEDAMGGHQRPKFEEYGACLFVVLQTLEIVDQSEIRVGEVNLFVGANYILSVRNGCSQGFANVRERCETEPELLKNGSAFVLYAIMDTVVDRYFPIIEELEDRLEKIEERIFSQNTSARINIEQVYKLKQKLLILQHATMPLLEVVSKFHGGRVPKVVLSMQEYFRDVDDHVVRITKSIDSLREMSTTAIQVNFSLISLNESEVTKKLASYGALFAFPTAIAGIYGMNFKNMPELDWHWGYPMVVILICIVDIVMWFRFKKVGWL